MSSGSTIPFAQDASKSHKPPLPLHFGAPPPVPMAAVPAYIAEQAEVYDGDPAIEVSALFEDAVLEVRHLSRPDGAEVRGATRALLGSGAAALAGLLLLFLWSYAQVARHPAARHGHGPDAAAALLLLYGLGALGAGLSRRADERRDDGFSIGPDPAASFPAPGDGLPLPRFPLVRPRPGGGAYEVLFTAGMNGDLQAGDRLLPLAELPAGGAVRPAEDVPGAFALILPEGARLSLRHGETTFNVRPVPRPRRYPAPLRPDLGAHAYTLAVLGGAALFLMLLFSVPPDPKTLSVDAFLNDQRLIAALIKPPEPPEALSWLQRNPQPQAQQPARGESRPRRAPEVKAERIAQTPRPMSRTEAQAELRTLVRSMGILGTLDTSSLGRVAAGSALGEQAGAVLAGLTGTDLPGDYGVPGPGTLVATLPGGDPLGTVSLSGLPRGTPGGDRDYGRGPRVPLRRHQTQAPEPSIGVVDVKGKLDKELVRRVIRQHVNEVRFCYEKELTRDGGLQGRVLVQFTILPTGAVNGSVVQSSTMGNPAVEQCIAGAVRRWQFPRPENGIVVASYPFVLKRASTD